jgi:hypothetical protein
MGYSADVYVSDLTPPVLGSKAGIRCTDHPTCVNYDGHVGPHSIPKKRETMRVFAVYYDEDTTGYKLKFYNTPEQFKGNEELVIPNEMLFKSIVIVTEDGRVLKNRFGGITPKPEPEPEPQTVCVAPHCELPAGHELGHYQTLPVKPFKLTLSELSITELCLLHGVYANTDSQREITNELNSRWSWK